MTLSPYGPLWTRLLWPDVKVTSLGSLLLLSIPGDAMSVITVLEASVKIVGSFYGTSVSACFTAPKL